jgi:competence protein ComEA
MDEAVAPWRALEDPPAGVVDGNGAGEGTGRHPSRALGLVVAAAILGVIAFWLAASANRGSVVVDGASAQVEGTSNADLLGSSPPRGSGGSTGGEAELVVDVQGAVARPGVLHLPRGSRVGDGIAAAGGFGPRVAADRVGRELNMAAVLHDGDQIVVPSRDDPGSAGGPLPTSSVGSSAGHGPVDLNRATASELDSLPGIGPVTANKIIAARDEERFASVHELRSRKILGAATFEKIKDLVVVR